ncbi:MAG: hypothetical protein KIT46_01140 [Anaerolineales bacterium]|nr:hypothetical protein [Anaerolineales bacterium]MCW5854628.1 hypothetical protein [Anaerolineales bacterium]
MQPQTRFVIEDGQHTKEALSVLAEEIQAEGSLEAIVGRARRILELSVDPVAGAVDPSYGLLYGLIQSGKTSIITVTAAMAADNGFKCIIILTSDINPLYDQTLQRIRSQLRGLAVLGKADWNDYQKFERYLRTSPFAIVCSKNANHLSSLLEAFKKVGAKGARGLATMIIDDEADQASLNTKARFNAIQRTNELSRINNLITDLRSFFQANTYLQVTATPQALFLQRPDGFYRPSFTVLSEPGFGYVGGEAFFEDASKFLVYVPLEETEQLKSGHQPHATTAIPRGMRRAFLSFLVGATTRNLAQSSDAFAFLVHISHTRVDHENVVTVIDAFREEVMNALNNPGTPAHERMREEIGAAYADIEETEGELPDFEVLVDRIKFLLPGASIKTINSTSDSAISLDHVYSIFVGGNKLGRGVTIPNLITSYYGRNPKSPNADTVLQHARMYGYRGKHLGITRLFLPKKLADHFRIIHQMEKALRDLVSRYPEGKFEGIYISSPLRPTRGNVLDPNAIGVYVAGGYCNPRYPLRNKEIAKDRDWLDQELLPFDDRNEYHPSTIDFIKEIINKCKHDPDEGAEMWDIQTLEVALDKLKTLRGNRAYLRVRTGRNLNEPRRETQGFLTGGEEGLVPSDAPTLFIYRINENDRGEAVWWPQIRFPEGNYALAFSFDR